LSNPEFTYSEGKAPPKHPCPSNIAICVSIRISFSQKKEPNIKTNAAARKGGYEMRYKENNTENAESVNQKKHHNGRTPKTKKVPFFNERDFRIFLAVNGL
jgi:hypothetical protein